MAGFYDEYDDKPVTEYWREWDYVDIPVWRFVLYMFVSFLAFPVVLYSTVFIMDKFGLVEWPHDSTPPPSASWKHP